jgi:hypothetical protein
MIELAVSILLLQTLFSLDWDGIFLYIDCYDTSPFIEMLAVYGSSK